MREEIIRAMAMTEALIDFGEGEDVEEGVFDHGRLFLLVPPRCGILNLRSQTDR